MRYVNRWLFYEKFARAARVGKIQSLSLDQSPFDRRWGTAKLRIDTAGGKAAGPRLRLHYLDADVAQQLQKSLGAQASAATLRW